MDPESESPSLGCRITESDKEKGKTVSETSVWITFILNRCQKTLSAPLPFENRF